MDEFAISWGSLCQKFVDCADWSYNKKSKFKGLEIQFMASHIRQFHLRSYGTKYGHLQTY